MEVTNIVHETMTAKYAERVNEMFRWRWGAPQAEEGDMIYYDIVVDGVTYKSVGRYREEDLKNEESVRSFLDKHKRGFKREYHWLLTKDQEGTYKFYRSGKQLNTLQRELPEKFAVVNKE